MKIIVYAPHPDDELLGCGGSILKWIAEGHEIHIIYVTDNRALFRAGHVNNQKLVEESEQFRNLSEDEIADIALKEAINVGKALGLNESNIHLFKIHDLDAENKIDLGVSLSKEILKDAGRIIIPSDNNSHPDHQATHLIAKKTAEELNIRNVEFFVYSLYLSLKIPREKLMKINIVDYRDRVFDIMKIYKTQICFVDTRGAWQFLKRKRFEKFGVFTLSDTGNFYNF